jgi:hypothetical protein
MELFVWRNANCFPGFSYANQDSLGLSPSIKLAFAEKNLFMIISHFQLLKRLCAMKREKGFEAAEKLARSLLCEPTITSLFVCAPSLGLTARGSNF